MTYSTREISHYAVGMGHGPPWAWGIGDWAEEHRAEEHWAEEHRAREALI
ncbi:hypothetical protein [Microcoleus sp. herbarium14]